MQSLQRIIINNNLGFVRYLINVSLYTDAGIEIILD